MHIRTVIKIRWKVLQRRTHKKLVPDPTIIKQKTAKITLKLRQHLQTIEHINKHLTTIMHTLQKIS